MKFGNTVDIAMKYLFSNHIFWNITMENYITKKFLKMELLLNWGEIHQRMNHNKFDDLLTFPSTTADMLTRRAFTFKVLYWWLWNLVQISLVPRGWSLVRLVIPWLFLLHHHQVKVYTYPVQFLNISINSFMDWHKILYRHSWFQEDES